MTVGVSAVVLFAPSPGGGDSFTGADKVVHALLFAVLAAAASARLGRGRGVLGAVLAYAVLSELVQVALPTRSGDLLDVVADVVGALVGWRLVRRVTPAAPRSGAGRARPLGPRG